MSSGGKESQRDEPSSVRPGVVNFWLAIREPVDASNSAQALYQPAENTCFAPDTSHMEESAVNENVPKSDQPQKGLEMEISRVHGEATSSTTLPQAVPMDSKNLPPPSSKRRKLSSETSSDDSHEMKESS